MNKLSKKQDGCPHLFLAPMEGIGDRPFRRAMASIGGFDDACTEFLRVPANACISSLAKRYHAHETLPIPQAVQLMGADPSLMAQMAQEMEKRGAPRIDLNCGCPSNTVTGRGAGSSLLKEPNHLYKIAKAMVEAVSIPVTAKLRAGFEDTSLFKENLLAAQESGIHFLTLHPRTKVDGYGPPARWELIAEAKQLLKIPVVGNGDILTVQDALNMLHQTKCDALMIGRGSVRNPFIFQEIKSHFSKIPYIHTGEQVMQFLYEFKKEMGEDYPPRTQINKLKQLVSFLFRLNPWLEAKKQQVLSTTYTDSDSCLSHIATLLIEGWNRPIFDDE